MKRNVFRLMSLALSLALIFASVSCGKKEKEQKKPEKETVTEEKLPETVPNTEEEKYSLTPLMKGIDVSKWQGDVDWSRVKAGGVEFAMIRLGHSDGSGECFDDPKFSQNLQKAGESGLLTGVYFYSQAKNEGHAKQEAEYVLSRLDSADLALPVVLDYEWTETLSDLTPKERGDIALCFLEVIRQGGYEPMLYVPISELEDSSLWETERIFQEVMVWGASYDAPVYPEKQHPNEKYPYAMWQYSNTGKVDGISGNVDLNLAYFEREAVVPPPSDNTPPPTTNPPPTTTKREFNQTFTSCNKRVTAKVEVNLRAIPSIDGEMLGTLKNGEYVTCTGESDMGWSRLDWNGKRVFAVTTYLVDDGGGSTVPQQNFTPVEEQVTAKDTVNLRLTPGTEGQIVGELKNGEYLVRTGIGDKGWSRLNFNGQTVYAVTSYLQVK